MMNRYMASLMQLGAINRLGLYALALGMVVLIIFLDTITGYEMGFSLFYLAPVSLVSWYLGRVPGLIFSLICAAGWFFADFEGGHIYSHWELYIWNAGVRLGIFIIMALLVSSLKSRLDLEHHYSRTDALTGTMNSVALNEILQVEIDRLERYEREFTLIFIDIDHFKKINDQFGHHVGDQALVLVVEGFKAILRKTDSISRIGGDEFILLLPETGKLAAKKIFKKIQHNLVCLLEGNQWPITHSAGILTCISPSYSVSELCAIADKLMYAAKKKGGNRALSRQL